MPMAHWIDRISRTLDPASREHIVEALRLHQRYRFDPAGLNLAERTRLRELCMTVRASP